MASSSADSFLQLSDDSLPAASTRPFDDPRLSSQRFDSFSNFADSESVVTIAVDDSLIYVSGGEFSPIRWNYRWNRMERRSTVAMWRRMGRFCLLRRRWSPSRDSLLANGRGKMQFDLRRRREGEDRERIV